MDMYTFSDYCCDFKILTLEQTNDLRHLKVMWDIYEEDYKDYCKAHGYEYEVIP